MAGNLQPPAAGRTGLKPVFVEWGGRDRCLVRARLYSSATLCRGPRGVGSAGLITGCRLPGILVSVFTPPFDFSPKPAFTMACWGIAVSCLHVKRPAWFPCCHIHRPAPWFVPVFHAHLQRGHSGPVQSVGEACASRSRPWLCVFPGSGRQWSSPLRRVSGEPCS